MAVFGDGDDHVERGEWALELHPELAAAAGNVRRLRRFGEQTFVAGVEGEKETVFNFLDRAAKPGAGELQTGLLDFGYKALQEEAALGERSVEQGAVIEKEQIEGHKTDRHLGAGEEIDLLAAEALLEFREGNGAAVAPADDFAVEDEIASDVADGIEKLGKFGDAVERAGIDFDFRGALVDLRADAIEFVFDEGAVGERGDEVGKSFRRAGEHDGNGAEELERDRGKLPGGGEPDNVGDVAG